MGIVIVDGKEIEIGDQERLNGIQIARRAGAEVPHYCWHPGLSVVASCRMCLVETGAKNKDTGAITMMPKLVPACQTPAKDGVVFVTNSDWVKRSRAQVEESLVIDHPIDCPICDKAGECLLQDYHFEYGQEKRRADLKPFTSRKREMGDTVTLFVDRCVMCTRCVRFTREITGTSELMVINRGSHEEIDVFPGYPLDNKMSGNVVDLCPVGALGDKDFLYQQRVWFMKKHDNVCAGCSTGCSISIDENQDNVYRLKPRENAAINGWWMCDEGRYGFKHVHAPERLTEARKRSGNSHVNIEWSQLPGDLKQQFATAGHLGVAISPLLTVEEAYLLCKWARQIDPNAVLSLGYVPTVGADEKYPNGFTIHAEKAPNRLGVENVIAHFGGEVAVWEEFVELASQGKLQSAWITAGYPLPWIDETTAAKFDSVKLLVVQDIFDSPLWKRATYQLPGGTFAERAGSYVNFAQRLQSFKYAIRPPAGVWVEGQLFWHLLARRGLYNPRLIMTEAAAEISYLFAAADEVPAIGVDLAAKQLAGVS